MSSKAARLVVCSVLLVISGSSLAGEKLNVFILAGQSNTVGHARAHTIATLYHSDDARDKELVELVFGDDSGISKMTLEEQLNAARKIDELTGGISNDKIKAMVAITNSRLCPDSTGMMSPFLTPSPASSAARLSALPSNSR